MTKKIKKPTPANLTVAQKKAMLQEILAQYPNLEMHKDVLEIFIEEYNKDKDYPNKIMSKANPLENLVEPEPEFNGISTYSPDDPEYAVIMRKMEAGRREYQEKMDKAYEEEQKNKSHSSITDEPIRS